MIVLAAVRVFSLIPGISSIFDFRGFFWLNFVLETDFVNYFIRINILIVFKKLYKGIINKILFRNLFFSSCFSLSFLIHTKYFFLSQLEICIIKDLSDVARPWKFL